MAIIIKNLFKSFGEKAVFSNFSLTVPDGVITVLTGPSGCGKSTLLRIIAELDPPDSGVIEGVNAAETAFLFQSNRLLPWKNAIDNITAVLPSGGKAEREMCRVLAQKWLTAVGLAGEERTKPHELSGGMARRVALARLLAYSELHDKRLLLLDEPFSGVDIAARGELSELLRRFSEGRTLIIVSHEDIEIAQNVMRL